MAKRKYSRLWVSDFGGKDLRKIYDRTNEVVELLELEKVTHAEAAELLKDIRFGNLPDLLIQLRSKSDEDKFETLKVAS